MKEDIKFFGGIAVVLYVILGTFFGTALLASSFGSWGLLAVATWPLIAIFLIWFTARI